MGQRHQFYVIYNKEERDGKVKEHRVAFHHQWAYGTIPLSAVYRLAKYQENAGKYSAIGGSVWNEDNIVLENLISTGYEDGYFHNLINLTKEDEGYNTNPLMGDNNDGITIVDFRGEKPKVCFMYLWDTETLDEEKIKGFMPLTCSEYLHIYYKKEDEKLIEFVERIYPRIEYIETQTDYLTQDEVNELFPVFVKEKEEAKDE